MAAIRRALDDELAQGRTLVMPSRLVTLNGVQTQSGKVCNLATELRAIESMEVDVLRISPQSQGTAAVVDAFSRRLRGAIDDTTLARELAPLAVADTCNGFWHGKPGFDRVGHAQPEAAQ